MGKKDANLDRFVGVKVVYPNVPRYIVIPLSVMDEITPDALVDYIKGEFKWKYLAPLFHAGSTVSVRSSGSVSTPGRMETVLNVTEDTLDQAMMKVYNSSKSSRLKTYLELKEIKDFEVNIIIQEMVHGDKDEMSCSGVLLTRNPFGTTSYDKPYIEFLPQSTGDRLMSGEQTPLNDLESFNSVGYKNLLDQLELITKEFVYICEVEFVIESDIAYILQIRKYEDNMNRNYSSSIFYMDQDVEFIGHGMTVINHSAKGTVTFDKAKVNKKSILVVDDTNWEDTKMMMNCGGIITRRGGRLSHASIISKEFEIPCVVGAQFEEVVEGQEILFNGKGDIYKIL